MLGPCRRGGVLLLAALLAACGGTTIVAGGGTSGNPPAAYVPGTSYYGTDRYVEYIAGDLPVIVLAPHGGPLRPSDIPDRASPDTLRDAYTLELARTIDSALYAATGRHPHVVLCALHRIKVDCNRDETVGAGTNAAARRAWEEFQWFIDLARTTVLASSGRGLLIDLHGHGHAIQRLELGYLLRDSVLDLPDPALDLAAWRDSTSIRDLLARTAQPLTAVLRGPTALGSLFASQGYPAVPSAADPAPNGTPYFEGGYNTLMRGSKNGGTLNAVQIETNYAGVRDTPAHRSAFAGVFALAVRTYAEVWLGLGF